MSSSDSSAPVEISAGVVVQSPRGQGQVLSRQGMRVRVQYADNSTKWEELKNLVAVSEGASTTAGGGAGGGAARHAAAHIYSQRDAYRSV